jgi:hypothetical protein
MSNDTERTAVSEHSNTMASTLSMSSVEDDVKIGTAS